MNKIIIITVALFAIILGCTKKNTSPNTNSTNTTNTINNDTTIIQKLKWQKLNYLVTYKADGVTEQQRLEYKYDSEGRIIEYKLFLNGQLSSVQRDYVYIGNEATYFQDSYVNGTLTTTIKAKVGYNND